MVFTLQFATAAEVRGRVSWPVTPQSQTVVWIEGAKVDATTIKQPVVIRQKDMQFSPSFLVVSRGQAIQFPNEDVVIHSVYSKSATKSFDLGTFEESARRSVIADRSGVIEVQCAFHRQMSARILVVDSAYYATAHSDGTFTIGNVPEGKYRVKAWHADGGITDLDDIVVANNAIITLPPARAMTVARK